MKRKRFTKLLLFSPILFLRTVIYVANAALQVLDQVKYEIESVIGNGDPIPMRSASEAYSQPVEHGGDIDDHSPFIVS